MSINFNTNYQLENEVVLLRPLQQDDIHFLLPFATNEPELWKYSAVSPAGTIGMLNYIKQAIQARAEEKEYPFIVFDKRSGKYAGSTRFYDIQSNNKALQLGYTWYGREFQVTGLNRNCKLLLLQFAFEDLGFERVGFMADNDNAKSIAAMKSIGCIVEGILRSNMPKATGGRRDSIVLSILKTEWEGGVKQHLQSKIDAFQLKSH